MKILKWLFRNYCSHVWSKWQPYGYTYQERSCAKCGFTQVKGTSA